MRKNYLLWMIFFLSVYQLNAQTYCVPTAGTSSQAYYLKNAVFSDQGALYYTATAYQAYVDNSSSQIVTSYPGGTMNVHLDFVGSAKSYVWIDWNNDGDFDDFYENALSPSNYSVVDDLIFIPPSQAVGIYRIRVQSGTSFPNPVNPCGPNNYGNFVDFSLKVEASPSCFVPTTLTSSNITNNSAVISWSAPATAPGSYEYYYTSSTTVPDASTLASGSSNTTSAPVSGLLPFTTYYYYIRSVCNTSSKSAWSLRGILKTKCDAKTSMFEDFENAVTGPNNADCWDRIILGSGYQNIASGSGVNSSKAMYQSANGAANATIAVLPTFSNVNAGTHWLRFKAKVSSTAGILDIGYVTNDSDASSFVNIQSVNISNTVYDGYEYSVVVPNTVPANARLAIRHGGVPSVNIYWDNVYWEPKPTCFVPTNVVLSNATSATANITWTAPTPAPAMGYDIYYSTNNTPPVSTTAPTITGVTANPYTIQGLNSATTYYVWVRSRCSASDQSAWSNIASVLTLCAPVTTLSENFDTYATGLLTNAPCWGRIITGNASVNINGSGALSGTRHILQRSISAGDVSIAVLPELSNINAGTHSLKLNAYCSVNTGKLEVGYVTNPTDASTFILIQQLNITNTSYTPATGTSEYTVAIPNTVPAGARLAIRDTYALSGNAQYYWDNISWAPTQTMNVHDNAVRSEPSIYPNPFTDLITITNSKNIQSVMIYDASGKFITDIRNFDHTMSLKELASGVYLVKMVMKDGTSKTIKAIKK
ncbi:fibronectin type III domain-containing protein [Chryseobacterium sediminis]|uniref:T9SS type A sorting domain-containing protein n=1 Tax=Chryseobacterium sediminis TaxID=1679494 RepID=A0A5B2TMA8_9FLAO|nr:fibronectin type III domain-containing protein [Chryseobacterium sediminis]KAA2215637.1 T9SS type A sorting domain-containing protein [Chryseobacterium sediminis]